MSTAIDQVLDLIGNMTVLELSELKKKYEDKFGVTAAAPMMAMPMGGGAGGAAVVEEQTEFDVVLTGVGDKKIQVIKVVRELVRARPAATKGTYIKSLTMSATMGPGITLDPAAVTADLAH